jgi:membrane associated rhomboid family serine protease
MGGAVIDERARNPALANEQSGRPRARREPVFTAPTVVIALIAILIIVHTIREWLPPHDDREIIILLAFIPARLTEIGAGLPGGLTAGYTSTLSHAFLHADWLHLMVNCAWLLAFGALIARRCGPVGFLAMFAASSMAGALFFFLVNANQLVPLVGASGGISGLMGGAFRVIFSASNFGGINILREHPLAIPRMPLQVALFDRATMTGVGLWLAVNLIFGLGLGEALQSGEIAWEAHVGGFLFGFLLFRWFDRGPGYREFRERYPDNPAP